MIDFMPGHCTTCGRQYDVRVRGPCGCAWCAPSCPEAPYWELDVLAECGQILTKYTNLAADVAKMESFLDDYFPDDARCGETAIARAIRLLRERICNRELRE